MPLVTDPQDAILRVTSSCICGSDLHFYAGAMPGRLLNCAGCARRAGWGAGLKGLSGADREGEKSGGRRSGAAAAKRGGNVNARGIGYGCVGRGATHH